MKLPPPVQRSLLVPAALITCWLGMMLVHECGHILAALVTGGQIQKLVFHPLAFSRTDIDPNPRFLLVTWSGPLFGAIFPFLFSVLLRSLRIHSWLIECFAAFCLLANGVYLTFGSLDRAGDTGDLLKHGIPIWLPWLLGLPMILSSLFAFHALGPALGIRRTRPVDLYVSTLLALSLILAGLRIDGR